MGIYSTFAGGMNRVLKRGGYQIIRLPIPPVNCRLRALERLNIDLVLDVGANVGQYASELRAYGYRGRIISFEPLPDAFAKLSAAAAGDALWEVRNVAAGAAPARLTMHVSENSVSSSLLRVTSASVAAAPASRATRTTEVDVITLDKVLADAAGARIMLKIDTQGYEWSVLQGCGVELAKVLLLDVEMSLQPLYDDTILFETVDNWIVQQGFRRLGFDTSFWNRDSGELLGLDGIYARA